MNRSLRKSLILAIAIAVAVGGVLFFIQTVVSPPENIKTEDVHTADIQKFSNSYPLAELSQCILDSSNGSIINVI